MTSIKTPEGLPDQLPPESLKEYFGNTAIRRAVDALVDVLCKKDMPEITWREAQDYNQAILMAAQVRADFAGFLFDLWDQTFGQVNPEQLGEEYFETTEHSPTAIWSSWQVCRSYYVGNSEKGYDFIVACPKVRNKFELQVWHWIGSEDSFDYSKLPELKLTDWSKENNEEGQYFANNSADIQDFFKDPNTILERLRRESVAVVNAICESLNER